MRGYRNTKLPGIAALVVQCVRKTSGNTAVAQPTVLHIAVERRQTNHHYLSNRCRQMLKNEYELERAWLCMDQWRWINTTVVCNASTKLPQGSRHGTPPYR